MTARHLHITPRAEGDLDDIYVYTSRTWSPRQAADYLRKLGDALAALAGGREIGRATGLRSGGLRLSVGSHVVFYRIEGDLLVVVRVLHAAMDFERHFDS